MTDYNIPRESHYNRPMLYPPEGETRVPYSRPSTLGKDLDTGKALIPWEQTMVAIGLAKSRYLFSRIQAIIARGGSWDTDKKEFKEIVGLAKNAAGWKDQADRGTSIHDFCDAAEQGILDWDLVPEHLKPVIAAYFEQIIPWFTMLATECFVVVDRQIDVPHHHKLIQLRSAGSVDRIGTFDGKRYIFDIKSGRDDVFRTSVCGQLYLYSAGLLYRDDLVYQDISWAEWKYSGSNPSARADTGVNQEQAIMLQAPKFAVHGKWTWNIFWVPLEKGRDIVECGQWARKARVVPEFKRVEL